MDQLLMHDPAGTCQLVIATREDGRWAQVHCDCGWSSERFSSSAEAIAAALWHDGRAHGQGVPSRPGPSQ